MKVLLPFLALYRRHWFRISLGIVLAFFALVASVGLLTLSGWFLAASALAGAAGIYSFNYMLPAGGVRAGAIVRTAARYAERVVSHDATFRLLSHLRVFTFRKLLPLSPAGIAKFRQAELLNRLVADVDTLDHLYLRIVSPLISAFFVVALVTFGLSMLNLSLALVLGGILLTLLLLLPILFYHAGKPVGYALTQYRAEYRTELNRWLQGHAELVIFSALSRFSHFLNSTEHKWLHQQQRQAHLSGLSQAIMVFASGATVVLILWLAAPIYGQHSESSALIALFVFASLSAFEALGPVAGAFQHLGHVLASAYRVEQLLSIKPDVSFPVNHSPCDHTTAVDITIDNLSFTYPDQPQKALSHIHLHIKAGEHVALLGRTGCGKSTLLQLITRAWDAQQGSIHINDRAITDYTERDLRQLMSVVSQRVYLFSATLRENLLLAAPDASDSQLAHVLTQVDLPYLLDDQGLDRWLGEGGRQLSGGEQRRIGIARILLRNAPIVLLDEPTEGLDAETEKQMLQLIRQHCQHKTLIWITHRLSGLALLDRICVLDAGELVEQGSHQQLLALDGHYQRLLKNSWLNNRNQAE